MPDKQFMLLPVSLFLIVELFIMYKHFRNKKYKNFIENCLTCLIIIAFFYLKNKYFFQISDFILIIMLLTILGNSFIGDYLDIYHKSKYYDRFLHMFGSFSAALFTYSLLLNFVGSVEAPYVYTSLFVAAVGISIGVFFEIAEFVHDGVFKKSPRGQHGLIDTDVDLIFNVIGAAVAGVLSTPIFHP